MRRGIGIRGWRNILRFQWWLMWGVGIQKNKKTFCEFGYNVILLYR